MIDIDNGPWAMVSAGNGRLYSPAGLCAVMRAPKPGGRAVFWSADENREFMRRLAGAGFLARAHDVDICAGAGAGAGRAFYTLFVAEKEKASGRLPAVGEMVSRNHGSHGCEGVPP